MRQIRIRPDYTILRISYIGDQELIISTYHMSKKLRGAPRLLFGNGCFWLDDIAEVKKKSLADTKFNFLQIGM